MARRILTLIACMAVFTLLAPAASVADWPKDGARITSISFSEFYPQAVSDGAGGAIMAWTDYRSLNYQVYLQRVDAHGNVLWVANGVAACAPDNHQSNMSLVSDGAGGAIVVWEDMRATQDVYAQRVDGDGNVLWGACGVIACTATGMKRVPQAVADGSGGVYIAWQDYRSGTNYDIYAQRLDASGARVWSADGVAVCTATAAQEAPEVAMDAAGLYIAWKDLRNGNYDIYAHRINPNGSVAWSADGTAVCIATGTQEQYQLIPNGFGGSIVVWRDSRSTPADIYFQLLNASGSVQWAYNGVVVSTATGEKRRPQIIPDGTTAGAFIVWEFNSGGWDVYAQRTRSSSPLWGATGVVVCSVPYNEENPQLVRDGDDGVIVTWTDSRIAWDYDIYAQRLDGNGAALWPANGAVLAQQPLNQTFPQLVSDGERGAIVVWQDYRNFTDYNIYAQRIEENGYWGNPAPAIADVRDVPGDQGGSATVAWYASRLDPLPDAEITSYTIWRALPGLAAQAALDGGAELLTSVADIAGIADVAGNADAAATHPVLRAEELAGTTYFWEMVASVNAYYLDAYAKVVPTLFDSTATTGDAQVFQVIAHTADATVFWISAPDSGRSVDNLAPAAPAELAGTQVFVPAGLKLTWQPNAEADLARYAVYRGTSPDFVISGGNRVATLTDTTTTDGAWSPGSGYYYKVTAIDVHGNEGLPALLVPDAVTGAPRLSFTLSVNNYPNPFNPGTTVSYTVPSRGRVTVTVYDARGALVATLFDGERNAGAFSVDWDGRAAGASVAASGVYFARIEHNGATRTKKMLLLK